MSMRASALLLIGGLLGYLADLLQDGPETPGSGPSALQRRTESFEPDCALQQAAHQSLDGQAPKNHEFGYDICLGYSRLTSTNSIPMPPA